MFDAEGSVESVSERNCHLAGTYFLFYKVMNGIDHLVVCILLSVKKGSGIIHARPLIVISQIMLFQLSTFFHVICGPVLTSLFFLFF